MVRWRADSLHTLACYLNLHSDFGAVSIYVTVIPTERPSLVEHIRQIGCHVKFQTPPLSSNSRAEPTTVIALSLLWIVLRHEPTYAPSVYLFASFVSGPPMTQHWSPYVPWHAQHD